MQYPTGGQYTPRGKDPDSKWVHWLALSRRNKPGSMVGTSSSSSASSSLSQSPSNTGDGRPLRSRSSATSYFALLSANEDDSSNGRSFTNHKQQGNVSGLTPRDMDSSWVAWAAERWQQRQPADTPGNIMQECAYSSEQSFLDINQTLPPSETLQMQKYSLPRDPENVVVSPTATTTTSVVSGSVGTTSPVPSPLNNLLDPDIDSLGTFTELLSNFYSALPFDPTSAPANTSARPCVTTTGLDDGSFTWLEEQHPFALHTSDESGQSSPTGKRGREGCYPGCEYPHDGHGHLESIANKKQKTFPPWNDRPETSSQTFSSGVSRSRQRKPAVVGKGGIRGGSRG